MKKIVKILGCLFLLAGCTQTKDEEKEPVVEEEKRVEIVSNEKYEDPKNPSNAYALIFNQLSEDLMNEDMEKVTEDVAICFVYDFFTLKNKENGTDVGGLTYLPQRRVEEFTSFAKQHYYRNYETIVKDYGKDSLPEVVNVVIDNKTETTVEYLYETYNGYEFDLTVEYGETKLSPEELKTTIHMTCLIYDMKALVIAVK